MSGPNSLALKGWTVDDLLHVEIRLESKDNATSLHSVHLVTPDGQQHRPTKWEDKTSRSTGTAIGIGMGVPGLGRHEGAPGVGQPTVGTSIPLGGKGGRGITDVNARWDLTGISAPLTNCRLEVVLVSVVIRDARMTTLPLLLLQPETVYRTPGSRDVREVDFATERPPAWLASPPPCDTGGVFIRHDRGAVGVVLPADIRKGDTVSGTVVLAPGSDPKAAAGLQLCDPAGGKHPLRTGQPVTFTAGATMTWQLIAANGTVVGKVDAPVAAALYSPAPSDKVPVVIQENCAFVLPGPFDGNSSNTVVRVDGRDAQVLTEARDHAVVVGGDLGGRTGKVAVTVTDGSRRRSHEGRAVTTRLDCSQLRQGKPGTATVIVNGLDGLAGTKLDRTIRVTVVNGSPKAVKLGDGKARHDVWVDPAMILDDGSCRFGVSVHVTGPGVFVLAASTGTARKGQCPSVNCLGCDSSFGFCDDSGKASCSGVVPGGCTCGGGAGHRRIGGPCGHWICGCSFSRCYCRRR